MNWQLAFSIMFVVWSLLATVAIFIHSAKLRSLESAWEDNVPKLWELCNNNFERWHESEKRRNDEIIALRKDIATGEDLDPLNLWRHK